MGAQLATDEDAASGALVALAALAAVIDNIAPCPGCGRREVVCRWSCKTARCMRDLGSSPRERPGGGAQSSERAAGGGCANGDMQPRAARAGGCVVRSRPLALSYRPGYPDMANPPRRAAESDLPPSRISAGTSGRLAPVVSPFLPTPPPPSSLSFSELISACSSSEGRCSSYGSRRARPPQPPPAGGVELHGRV